MNANDVLTWLERTLGGNGDTARHFELAAGEPREIEIGRSGTFRAKRGGTVELTPEKLAGIAGRFSPSADVKLKLGHGPIKTGTPDMGRATAVRYDVERDRLVAAVTPTESLVEKNRKGEFHAVSMELDRNDDGSFSLDAISFLGAHDPAIRGLARVELAEGGDRKVFICAANEPDEDDEEDAEDDVDFADFTAEERKKLAKSGEAMADGSFPIRNKADLTNAISAYGRASDTSAAKRHIIKRARALGATEMLPESWGKVAAAADDESGLDIRHKLHTENVDTTEQEKKMAEEKALLAEAEKKLKAAEERELKSIELAKKTVAADVKAFFASEAITKRLPLTAIKDGNLERVMVALAEQDIAGQGSKVMLAAGEGKNDVEASPFDALKSIFLAFPEKLGKDETAEKKIDDPDGEKPERVAAAAKHDYKKRYGNVVQFADSKFHEKVLARVDASGGKLSYEEASELEGEAQGRGN